MQLSAFIIYIVWFVINIKCADSLSIFAARSARSALNIRSWDVVCSSKDQRGLGMLDLKLMNKALLAKWWIRFLDNTAQGKWKDIIVCKYGSRTSPAICSPLWRWILKDHSIIGLWLNKQIGNGVTTVYWLDRWCFEFSLQHQYHNLLSIVQNRFIYVAFAFSKSYMHLDFKRQLTDIYLS